MSGEKKYIIFLQKQEMKTEKANCNVGPLILKEKKKPGSVPPTAKYIHKHISA